MVTVHSKKAVDERKNEFIYNVRAKRQTNSCGGADDVIIFLPIQIVNAWCNHPLVTNGGTNCGGLYGGGGGGGLWTSAATSPPSSTNANVSAAAV